MKKAESSGTQVGGVWKRRFLSKSGIEEMLYMGSLEVKEKSFARVWLVDSSWGAAWAKPRYLWMGSARWLIEHCVGWELGWLDSYGLVDLNWGAAWAKPRYLAKKDPPRFRGGSCEKISVGRFYPALEKKLRTEAKA
ncbi:hypothetical protein [Puniceicoccus vermicola]|uniref:Uncharacterized protein n=1 Tax=Puniceicoccus vermicola TaxID=388746 RepID=A0A7X1E633_9BACT|nr:hypothetical protein [Puniceicoccus vermicola]MBC2604265.1 hypothetical protein [Puniceicoccus vermicola]